MGKRIVWTRPSVEDLRELRQYIAQDSPENASNFIRRIRIEVAHIATHPQLGRVVPESEDPQIREIFVANYRVIYRAASRVEILRVQRMSRQLSTQDLDEPPPF